MEFVYVVKRRDLFDAVFPHGFVARDEDPEAVERILERIARTGFFVERRHAEDDPWLKQVIPYVVVRRGDEILMLRRMATQGEARLHDKISIGVGGHINPVDESSLAAGETVLEAGMRRELEEELATSGPLPVRWKGILNDDTNPVGAVHFGLVGVADATGIEVSVLEKDKMEGEFVSSRALREEAGREGSKLETWSRLLVERLGTILSPG